MKGLSKKGFLIYLVVLLLIFSVFAEFALPKKASATPYHELDGLWKTRSGIEIEISGSSAYLRSYPSRWLPVTLDYVKPGSEMLKDIRLVSENTWQCRAYYVHIEGEQSSANWSERSTITMNHAGTSISVVSEVINPISNRRASHTLTYYRDPPEEEYQVSLSPHEVRLHMGKKPTAQIEADVKVPEGVSSSLIWKSSEPEIVTVDDDGFITLILVGSHVKRTVLITAYLRADTGVYDTVHVRIDLDEDEAPDDGQLWSERPPVPRDPGYHPGSDQITRRGPYPPGVGLFVDFSWVPVPEAAGYIIRLESSSISRTETVEADLDAAGKLRIIQNHRIGNLRYGNDFRWRIAAFNQEGAKTDWSEWREFSLQPFTSRHNQRGDLGERTWDEAVNDVARGLANTYQTSQLQRIIDWLLDPFSNFPDILDFVIEQFGPMGQVTNAIRNAASGRVWAEAETVQLQAPVLTGPEGIVQDYGFRDTRFDWQPVSGAGSYRLELRGRLTKNEDNIESAGVWVRRLSHGDYRWRVAARDKDGNLGPWSDWHTFTYRTPSRRR